MPSVLLLLLFIGFENLPCLLSLAFENLQFRGFYRRYRIDIRSVLARGDRFYSIIGKQLFRHFCFDVTGEIRDGHKFVCYGEALQANGFSGPGQCLGGDGLGAPGAVGQNVFDVPEIIFKLGSFLSKRLELLNHQLGEAFFSLAIAHSAASVFLVPIC